MSERRAILHKLGEIVPGKIVVSSSKTDETFFPDPLVELRLGPSSDSEIIKVDPAQVQIFKDGEPANGFQKVVINYGEQTQNAYLIHD